MRNVPKVSNAEKIPTTMTGGIGFSSPKTYFGIGVGMWVGGLISIWWLMGATGAEAAGCCITPGDTCQDNATQFTCEQLYAPGTLPSGKYFSQSCSTVGFCSQTGKCEKQGSPTDCTNSTRLSCNERNDVSYIFYPNQQCGTVAAPGSCCVEPNPSTAQTRPTCLDNLSPIDCQNRLWQYYPRACSTVPNCNAATGTGTSTATTDTSGSATIDFIPEIPLPNFSGGPITSTTMFEYLRAVFIDFIWIVGALATVMVIFGGVKWVSAAGNPSRINDARETINSAIIGVIIALTSVVLLNIISPQFTEFRGLTVSRIDPRALDLVKSITTAAQNFELCNKTQVAGLPDKVCSGKDPNNPDTNQLSGESFGCLDVNKVVNQAAAKYAYTGIDAFAIKSIIVIESRKIKNNPYSGPERLASGGEGPSYGIGQFKGATLQEQLERVNPGGVPSACKGKNGLIDDGTKDGKISQGCRDWLDKRTGGFLGNGISGLEGQVYILANYFGQHLQDEKCVKGNFALAAASYNQGLGGARASFCNMDLRNASEADIAKIKTNALNYIAKFQNEYSAACNSGQ